jgi:hypothetical protein
MTTVEYWRWRYRNIETGRICRTMFPCSEQEAAKLYPGAERIQGTMVLREVDPEPQPRVTRFRLRGREQRRP